MVDVGRLIIEVYLYGAALQYDLYCMPCAAVVLEEAREALCPAYLLINIVAADSV